MNGFLKALLYLSFSGTLMALFLFAVKPVVKKRLSKRFWYYLWIPVLLRLCVPLGGIISVPPLAAEKATTVVAQTESVEIVQMPVDAFAADAQSGMSAQNTTGLQSPESTWTVNMVKLADSRPQQETNSVEMTEEGFGMRLLAAAKTPLTWCVVWAAGAAALTAFHLWSYCRFVRAVKRRSIPATHEELAQLRAMYGEKKTPGLRVCPLVSTPMLIGLFRPEVILPVGEYTQEELANILRHELSHYRRKDLVFKWAALAVNALHWFNPVVWLVRREINNACELACDEAVISAMSETERRSYGATLLNMAASRRLPVGIVATAMATNPIKERIMSIMKYKKMTALMLVAAMLLSAALCGCGIAFAAPAEENENVPEETAKVSVQTEETEAAETGKPTEETEAVETEKTTEETEISETAEPSEYYVLSGTPTSEEWLASDLADTVNGVFDQRYNCAESVYDLTITMDVMDVKNRDCAEIMTLIISDKDEADSITSWNEWFYSTAGEITTLYSAKDADGVILCELPHFEGESAELQRINSEIEEKYLPGIEEKIKNGDRIICMLAGKVGEKAVLIITSINSDGSRFEDFYELPIE